MGAISERILKNQTPSVFLLVAEVIKPIVRRQGVIIQKGVVIVESK